MEQAPVRLADADACVDAIIERVGKDIVLGLPLGLGKPIHLANAIYRRACKDPSLKLHIVTAISPLAPKGKSSLERRFMGPFAERLFGDIPTLEYAADVQAGKLPENVRVSEFFFRAGSFLNHRPQQQNYVCTNYTHAVRDLMALGVNVVAQLVAPSDDGETLSLSCNPDLSLDLMLELQRAREQGTPVAVVGETSANLPFFGHDAEVPAASLDILMDRRSTDYPLFPVPQTPVSTPDHLIGFYASTLLKDAGTLQVGIGSLGVAVVHSAVLRHKHNSTWRALFDELDVADRFPVTREWGGTEPFERGLYGCSEMMVDGFIALMEAGVLTREVFSHAGLQELVNEGLVGPGISLETLDALWDRELIHSPLRARDITWLKRFGILRPGVSFRGGRLVVSEQTLDPDLEDPQAREALAALALGDRLQGGVVMHGGFYLGPAKFYQQLRELSAEDRARICMTSVNFINHLYDHRFGNQRLKTVQRSHSRFINSAMMHTLNGAAVSDGLEDGRVVSGVGGQYNFVAMAHELPGARSILTLRSTRQSGGDTVSNIVFSYGHCTIPRHLRDIVVTEYGIADLRGRSDEDVYLALIRIADARFQPGLLKQAQKAGKVPRDFQLPESWRQNTPERIEQALEQVGREHFPTFPLGCAFTDEELVLGRALKGLKAATATRRGKLRTLWHALRADTDHPDLQPYLKRMDLERPEGIRERLDQRLLIHGLQRIGEPSSSGSSSS
ncbi:MAG: acetyl-CoA hydrolase/transferase C-terminal domain-containing protein [Marinobacter sp.]|uniref:acetyl-CoA hydrolase/transferase C-terminal domain-containing protein n=1 Tax=Marinobacter sp. TaxID=50741 RepID=UPI00299E18A5|nr:acetyl-CoA hydrolase/transferase C-terminal domain-containing protein [Marinobacter sp.]MDX1633529.1 acetyl-CoA hydrolase/transferase C-terminal domain-containing protein [Marinobacter sp.]